MHACSLRALLSSADGQFSIEKACAFDHAANTKRIKFPEIGQADSTAVVPYLQLQLLLIQSRPHPQPNPTPRGAGMLGNIGEGLLKNANSGNRHIRLQVNILLSACHLARDAKPFAEFVCLPLDGRDDAEI